MARRIPDVLRETEAFVASSLSRLSEQVVRQHGLDLVAGLTDSMLGAQAKELAGQIVTGLPMHGLELDPVARMSLATALCWRLTVPEAEHVVASLEVAGMPPSSEI